MKKYEFEFTRFCLDFISLLWNNDFVRDFGLSDRMADEIYSVQSKREHFRLVYIDLFHPEPDIFGYCLFDRIDEGNDRKLDAIGFVFDICLLS
jgi:hypothetical protein